MAILSQWICDAARDHDQDANFNGYSPKNASLSYNVGVSFYYLAQHFHDHRKVHSHRSRRWTTHGSIRFCITTLKTIPPHILNVSVHFCPGTLPLNSHLLKPQGISKLRHWFPEHIFLYRMWNIIVVETAAPPVICTHNQKEDQIFRSEARDLGIELCWCCVFHPTAANLESVQLYIIIHHLKQILRTKENYWMHVHQGNPKSTLSPEQLYPR